MTTKEEIKRLAEAVVTHCAPFIDESTRRNAYMTCPACGETMMWSFPMQYAGKEQPFDHKDDCIFVKAEKILKDL